MRGDTSAASLVQLAVRRSIGCVIEVLDVVVFLAAAIKNDMRVRASGSSSGSATWPAHRTGIDPPAHPREWIQGAVLRPAAVRMTAVRVVHLHAVPNTQATPGRLRRNLEVGNRPASPGPERSPPATWTLAQVAAVFPCTGIPALPSARAEPTAPSPPTTPESQTDRPAATTMPRMATGTPSLGPTPGDSPCKCDDRPWVASRFRACSSVARGPTCSLVVPCRTDA